MTIWAMTAPQGDLILVRIRLVEKRVAFLSVYRGDPAASGVPA
jgi:hypothetical protein